MFTYPVDKEITLRLVGQSDAPQLLALFDQNRAHIEAWQDWPRRIQTLADCEAYILRHEKEYAEGKTLGCVIVYQGEVVGWCALTKIVPSLRKAFLSYWIAEAHQGKGIVTRSCRGLLTHAFETMQLNRVALQFKRAHADHENTPSRRVAERLGFTQEGILRQDGMTRGVMMDMVLCSLLAEEWDNQP